MLSKMASFLEDIWVRVPETWRRRVIIGVIVMLLSQTIKLVWGDDTLIVVLMITGCVGAFLYYFGVREARYADQMLGKVWDYFRGAIVFAIVPAAWPALHLILKGNIVDGLLQISIFGLIIASVFEKFSLLPRKMSQVIFPRRRR